MAQLIVHYLRHTRTDCVISRSHPKAEKGAHRIGGDGTNGGQFFNLEGRGHVVDDLPLLVQARSHLLCIPGGAKDIGVHCGCV